MQNLTNYHSHSLYCDGHAPITSFIDEAMRQGFTSYGVSPHAPLPWPTRWTMLDIEMPVYLYEMKCLKERYRGKIELYCGLEIDYIDSVINPHATIFHDEALDYKIGSVHLIYNRSGELVDIDLNAERFIKVIHDKFDNDVEYVIDKYFEAETDMLMTGGFDIVGHLDKISRNVETFHKGVTSGRHYSGLVTKVIETAVKMGYIIEVNTKAFEKQGITFVNREHYPLLADLRAKVVVNSDSHYPALINAGRMQALDDLKTAGVTCVMQLHHGKWCSVPIG